MFDQTKDPGAGLMRRFGDLIRAPALTTPDAWAPANRIYGPETGLQGPRNPYLSPSMVPLGRAAVSGLYRRVVGVTGAQTGKTDTVLDVIGQRLDQRPTPILYVGPSAEFNRDQFEPRLRRMIDESAGLSEQAGPRPAREEDPQNGRRRSGAPRLGGVINIIEVGSGRDGNCGRI